MRQRHRFFSLVIIAAFPLFLQAQTNDTSSRFRLAQSYEQGGDFENAVKLYKDLHAADPANYMFGLQKKKALVQKATNDDVIPNITTDRLAQLIGINSPRSSSPYNPGAPTVESAALVGGRTSIQVNYTSDANHEYSHGSLGRPATSTPTSKGQLGTMRMQIDFAQYLDNNDDANL